MPKKITVLGAGPGGYVAAVRAAQLGAEVRVIEQDTIGGTCLNWGCIPSKVMKTTAEILDKFQRAAEFGIRLSGHVSPDMAAIMERKRKVVEGQAEGIRRLFAQHKILYLNAVGRIRGKGLIEAESSDGEKRDVLWDSLILSPGSAPLEISSFPFDHVGILSSNDALTLQEIPESVLIVGGGVIGCEFAAILCSLGSKVTVVEALSRLLPLPSVDEDCSRVLLREMKKRRIKCILNCTVDGVERDGEGYRVAIGPSPHMAEDERKKVQPSIERVEKILVCIGRKPNTGDIGLEEIGIKTNGEAWIIADERMETTVPGVYAIGDVLGPGRPMLAHVASREGLVAAENAMGGNRKMTYDAVPGAIFTTPEVACVGLTQAQAQEKGYSVRGERVLFRNLGKAHAIGEIAGELKIVIEAASGKVLGVHMVGHDACNLIAEGTLAVSTGCTAMELSETIHAHPTLAEIMQEASLKVLGMPLHG